ncbi:hypothetical protein ACJX0J_023033, partial [Zea mays]
KAHDFGVNIMKCAIHIKRACRQKWTLMRTSMNSTARIESRERAVAGPEEASELRDNKCYIEGCQYR